jgi:hypothetical protein
MSNGFGAVAIETPEFDVSNAFICLLIDTLPEECLNLVNPLVLAACC